MFEAEFSTGTDVDLGNVTVLVEVVFGDIGSFACQKNCAPLEPCCFAFAEQCLPFSDLASAAQCDALIVCIVDANGGLGDGVGERFVSEESDAELFGAFLEVVGTQCMGEGKGSFF